MVILSLTVVYIDQTYTKGKESRGYHPIFLWKNCGKLSSFFHKSIISDWQLEIISVIFLGSLSKKTNIYTNFKQKLIIYCTFLKIFIENYRFRLDKSNTWLWKSLTTRRK